MLVERWTAVTRVIGYPRGGVMRKREHGPSGRTPIAVIPVHRFGAGDSHPPAQLRENKAMGSATFSCERDARNRAAASSWAGAGCADIRTGWRQRYPLPKR